MCTNPTQTSYRHDRPSDLKFRSYRYGLYPVPCGKCVECLKQKRQNVAVNAYRTAQRLPDMIFATFTYRDEALPMAFKYEVNGEIVNDLGFTPLDSDYRQMWFSADHPKRIIDDKVCTVCERSTFQVCSGAIDVKVHITPSLCRKDWRYSIKRQRVRYQREFGREFPEMKYMCIGEYGPRTNRPHFHALFWNLKFDDASYLFKDWEENYGHVDFHVVEPRKHKVGEVEIEDDGKFSCANYVAKYLIKGKYEYNEVGLGFVERPRKCISKDVGFVNDIEPEIENHLLGFDICRYDPNKFYCLPKAKQVQILQVISGRMYYPIQGRPYSIPLNIKHKVFYDKQKLPDGSIRFYPKQVQMALADFVRTQNDSVFEKLLRRNLQKCDSKDILRESARLSAWYEGRRHSDLSLYEQNYISTLQKSFC